MKLGDCFLVSGNLILENKFRKEFESPLLVHGFVTGQVEPVKGVRYLHAWVEVDDIVIDRSNGNDIMMPIALYYAIGEIRPDELKVYTEVEACKKMLETGCFGDWD